METQMDSSGSPRAKTTAKDFFINLGAIVALYTLVYNLVDLLFTVINKAYPQITGGGYDYSSYGSTSISFPVATLIIFFPIFIVLMWLLEKDYKINPEKQNSGIHKWLTYITLFISGLTIAGDLITVLYYFIDGRELTTGFLLKVLVLLVLAAAIFSYYIMDVLGKLTAKGRNIYRVVSFLIIGLSIIWGFSVLGSPRSQQLLKYDEQRVSDLQNIDNQITSFYSMKGNLPATLEEMAEGNYYVAQMDPQTKQPYKYEKTSTTTYNLCAEFNTKSPDATAPNIYARPLGYQSWIHPAGAHCFNQTINPQMYRKPAPMGY